MFFQEFLHICTVKFFSHIDLQIFRANLLSSRIIFAIAISFPFFVLSGMAQACLLNTSITIRIYNLWIMCWDAYQPATGHRIRKLWRLRGKFFSRWSSSAVLLPVVTFQDFLSDIFLLWYAKNVTKILRKRYWSMFRHRLKLLHISYSIYNKASFTKLIELLDNG